MTSEPGQRYEIRFQPAAQRAIAQRLPEAVAAAVLEFCDAALAVNPHRVGKPLFGSLAGCHGARRGTYRIVYRIDENSRIVNVLDNDHRPEIYVVGNGDHRYQQWPIRTQLTGRCDALRRTRSRPSGGCKRMSLGLFVERLRR